MTEAVEIALISGIAPVLATMISGGVAWIVSRNAAKKINEIHLIVNSQRSEMMEMIDNQGEKIRNLKNIIEELQAPRDR